MAIAASLQGHSLTTRRIVRSQAQQEVLNYICIGIAHTQHPKVTDAQACSSDFDVLGSDNDLYQERHAARHIREDPVSDIE